MKYEKKEFTIEDESDIQELKEELLKQLSTSGIRTEVTVWRFESYDNTND